MLGRTEVRLAVLFAVLFTLVGWVAPALYATYAPSDHFIEKNEFEATDVSVREEVHEVCFNRTVNRPASGTVITELYLVPLENGSPTEVLSKNSERYFQRGTYTIMLEVKLPDTIEPGTYRYRRVYRMSLAGGRVDRSFVFVSEPFEVEDGPVTSLQEPDC